MGWGGRVGLPKGTWFVAGVGNYLSHAGDLYDISRPNDERFANTKPGASDYKPMLYPGGWNRLDADRANQKALDSFRQPVLTSTAIYDSDNGTLRPYGGVAVAWGSLADLHRIEEIAQDEAFPGAEV